MKKKTSIAIEQDILETLGFLGNGNKSKGLEVLKNQREQLTEFAQSVDQYLELDNLEDMKRLIEFEISKIRGIL
jgi:hypothetical protein